MRVGFVRVLAIVMLSSTACASIGAESELDESARAESCPAPETSACPPGRFQGELEPGYHDTYRAALDDYIRWLGGEDLDAYDRAWVGFCEARSKMPCLPGAWRYLSLLASANDDPATCAEWLAVHDRLASARSRAQFEPIWRSCELRAAEDR